MNIEHPTMNWTNGHWQSDADLQIRHEKKTTQYQGVVDMNAYRIVHNLDDTNFLYPKFNDEGNLSVIDIVFHQNAER